MGGRLSVAVVALDISTLKKVREWDGRKVESLQIDLKEKRGEKLIKSS